MRVLKGLLFFVVLPMCIGFFVRIELLSRPQAAPAPLKFEVASIKPHPPSASRLFGGTCHGIDSRNSGGNPAINAPLGRCIFRNVTLRYFIGFAYDDPRGLRITGGPAWVGTEKFDLEAKTEDPNTTAENSLHQMLRNLMAEEFKMKLRRERREEPGFELVAAKSGPKLARSVATSDRSGTFFLMNLTLTGVAVGMQALAEELSFWLQKPVVDETGIAGNFDIRLKWTPGHRRGSVSTTSGTTIRSTHG